MSDGFQNTPPVLVLAPFGKDTALLTKVLGQSGITVLSYQTLEELTVAIGEESGAVILTEENLHDDAIGKLAQKLSVQARWSDLPLIVFTGSGTSTPQPSLRYVRVLPWGMLSCWSVRFVPRP